MLKMVDGTGIIGVDMVCPLGVSTPQPPNYDRVELEGAGMLVLPNSLDAPLERVELGGKTEQAQEPSPSPEYPQEIKNVGKWNEETQKYEVDVKVNSKNVFDKNIILPVSSYNIKGSPYNRKYFYLKPNTSYVVRVSGHYTTKLHNTSCFLATAIPAYDSSEANGLTTLIPDANNTERQMVFKTDSSGKMILKTLNGATDENLKKMLEQTDITIYYNNSGLDNKHEPYKEQNVQIALDEPLRGVGEYKDTITKDGVARRIKQITVDEKSNLMFYRESKNTVGYLVKVPDATQTNYIYSVISDRFVKTQYIDNNDTNGVVTLYAKQIIFRVSKEIANSVDALKEWLANNNITFNYVLESPIIEPLPESEQNAIRALTTYYPTTVITADGGELAPDIKVTYRKEI